LRYDYKKKKYRSKIKTLKQKKNINETNLTARKKKNNNNNKGVNKKPFIINKTPV